MSLPSRRLLKAVLAAIHYSGADSLVAPFTAGVGVIFMLHRVHPEPPKSFEPNRILKITPEFLEQVITDVLAAGFDIVTLDEIKPRLMAGGRQRPFACFTFDDGYRDNRDFALPVFRRHQVPMAVYVPSDFPDGKGDLWWLTLEESMRRSPALTLDMGSGPRTFDTSSDPAREAAWAEIYWWLRGIDENRARAVVADLARQAGYDPSPVCRELIMDWDELRAFAADPLVTIGGHTVRHMAVGKLPLDEARREVSDGIARIEAELGRPCRHFSFPYGCEGCAGPRDFALVAELGLETAVTTQKGLIYPKHAHALTALPRLSLNGDYQDSRFIKVMLSGAPFALWDTYRRLVRPVITRGGSPAPSI